MILGETKKLTENSDVLCLIVEELRKLNANLENITCAINNIGSDIEEIKTDVNHIAANAGS